MADIRYAFRTLAKRPAFTLVAVFTLAVGIGATTAIFSVVNGVLLRPLPYPEPGGLVRLFEQTAKNPRASVSYPNFRDWHDRLTSPALPRAEREGGFRGIAAYQGGTTTVLGGTEPVFADVYAVTKDFFGVMAVAPAIGRTFTGEETQEGGTPAVVVSRGFWERALQSNPDLSSLRLEIEGVSARVVGVMPAGFDYPGRAEVWFPKELAADGTGRTAHNLRVIARLDGPRERAAAQLAVVGGQLQQEYPGQNDAQSIAMVGLQETLTGGSRNTLLLLFGAVALVLLIACANVASTMFARGEDRRTELAIRAALGAGRGRLLRQLLVESLVLGGLGGATGLLLAGWLVRTFLAMNTTPLPHREAIGMDGAVLAFTLGLALVTPLLFGILPALQASRPDLRETIAEGGRGNSSNVRGRIRNLLVSLEVAVALVLLVGSVLLIRSFWNVMTVDTGFDARGIVTMDMSLPRTRYPEADRSARFYRELIERLRAVPGVQAAGAINAFPLMGGGPDGGLYFEGDPDPKRGARFANYQVVTPDYFAALRIPLVTGRLLSEADRAGGEIAVIVNEDFVRRYIPDGKPLGRRFKYFGMDSANEPMMTIVGVVGDMRTEGLTRGVVPEAYVSYLQRPNRTRGAMTVAVRPAQIGAAGALIPTLRGVVTAMDSDVPVNFSTMEERVGRLVADRRFMMAVLSAFAGIALLLAAVGIYSVLSHSVAQRTSEIGIRMALGADARSVVGLMLATAMRSVGAGVAAGTAAGVLLVRLLEVYLFEVKPIDPLAFAGAAVLLAAVALLAAYLPARRATRVDPLIALRTQ
jgi:putative ABC transport system permease protein